MVLDLEKINRLAIECKDVAIDNEKIDFLISDMKFQSKHWFLNNPFGLLDFDIKDIIYLISCYNSCCFCFWKLPKWEINIDGNVYDGSIALLACLIKRFQKNKEKLTSEEFKKIVDSNNLLSFLDVRCKNIDMLDENIYDKIKNFNSDIKLFEYVKNNFQFLKDISNYHGEEIEFYKLAQLLTNDILHLRKFKENIDIDTSNLVGCADYKIPQVLSQYGVLKYSDDLSEKIKNKIEIKHNSSQEIEIRICTLSAIDKIYKKLNKKYTHIEINDFIWLMSQNKSKITNNYHLTMTTVY